MNMRFLSLCVVLFIAVACSARHAPAPVESSTTIALADQRSVTITSTKQGGWSIYETGPTAAGLPLRAAHTDLINHGLVADYVRAVTGDHTAPAAVVDLQTRIGVPLDVELPRIVNPPAIAQSGGHSRVEDVPTCGNSCCDPNYVSQLFANLGDTDWEYINYVYSNHWADNVHHWNSTVCSAQGTSTLYYGNQDGSGGTYYTAEGFYGTLDWVGAGVCDGIDFCQADKILTFVNSQSDQHLHSYGGFALPF